MDQPLSVAPLTKRYQIGEDENLVRRSDVREVSQAAFDGNEIKFFREGVQDTFLRRYNMPFGGGRKRLLSLGFTTNIPIWKSTANVDPFTLINQIKHSAVIVTIGTDGTQILRGHMGDFLQFNRIKTVQAAYDDGTNSGLLEAVQVRSHGLRRLSETSLKYTGIREGQRMSVKIVPDSNSAFPAQGDWTTYQVPKLLTQIQLGYPDGEAPGQVGL